MKRSPKLQEVVDQQNCLQQRPGSGLVFLCIVLLALALLALKIAIAVDDPFFGGDAGHAMNSAGEPVLRLGNRIWLPWLQVHVWVFHFLNLPYYAFKLVPCFYFFLAVLSLGIIAIRVVGRSCSGIIFSLLVMLCFGYQSVIGTVSVQLHPEIIGTAFFYLLLLAGALDLGKSKLLLIISWAALLSRYTLWIYLFSLSLLNWKRILTRKSCRLLFILLWAVPAIWLFSIPFGHAVIEGRLPALPVEWPLMINRQDSRAISHLLPTLHSLWAALASSRILFPVAGLIVVWVTGALSSGSRQPETSQSRSFGSKFKPFSLLSLAIIYSLTLLFNPWDAPFGNVRMAAPMVEHVFLWVLILFGETSSYRGALKFFTRAILVASLLLSVNPHVSAWIPEDNSETEACHADIESLMNDAALGRTAHVCIVGERYWTGIRRFMAPTLYANRHFFAGQDHAIADTCDFVISPKKLDDAVSGNFALHQDCTVEGDYYLIYRKRAPVVADASRAEDLNVVLISIDTLRADHLGCYGYSRNTSPNIDRLAAASTVFLNAYSTAPATAESHMSMFTSLYPSVHKVWTIIEDEKIQVLDRGITTLPEILKNQGYATAGFHDGGFLDEKFGFGRGFDVYTWAPQEKAEEWIRANASKRKFFLFYHTYAVHDPYTPSAPYDTMFDPHYKGKITSQRHTASGTESPGSAREFWSRVDKGDPADVAHLVALYDGAIAELDNELGRLLDVIDRYAPRTIIIILADHGEQFGEHGGFQHGKLYNEVLRVPLIIRHPDRPGVKVSKRVSLIDLAPTILHTLSIPLIAQFQGKVLAGNLASDGEDDLIFAESPLSGSLSVFKGDRQLIVSGKAVKFHDLGARAEGRTDPGDSAAGKARGDGNDRALRDALRRFARTNEILAKALNRSKKRDSLSEERIRQLKSLGYIR